MRNMFHNIHAKKNKHKKQRNFLFLLAFISFVILLSLYFFNVFETKTILLTGFLTLSGFCVAEANIGYKGYSGLG